MHRSFVFIDQCLLHVCMLSVANVLIGSDVFQLHCVMWFADDVFMDDYDDDILLRDTLEHEHNVSKSGSTVPLVIWLCIIIIIFFYYVIKSFLDEPGLGRREIDAKNCLSIADVSHNSHQTPSLLIS